MRSIFAAILFLTSSAVFADSNGTRIFWAGFGQVKEKPQTAPSLPWDTQPVDGPVTLDFNNLKDPHTTPNFQTRKDPKDCIPGLSMCRVNQVGEMQIDLDLKNNCILMHGDNPAVTGYIGRRFIGQEPTKVEAKVKRIKPEEGGAVHLYAADIITGAFIMVQAMDSLDAKGSWALTYSNAGSWEDWKWWSPSPQGADWSKDVTLGLAVIKPGVFQASVNGRTVGPKISLTNLLHVTEFRIGGGARKSGLKVLELSAWRNEKLVNPKESVYKTTLTPLKTTSFKATNPYGNGIQAAYPEKGFAEAMNNPGQFEELAAMLRDMHIKLIRFPGGTWAYAYSPNGPESMDGLQKVFNAYILNRQRFSWCDARQFFRLCKAVGSDAIYQLNLSYWYDPVAKKAYRVCIEDATEDLKGKLKQQEYHLDKLPFALAEAKKIAGWAKEIGVKTIWEFGNEDYSYFIPKTYVKQCNAFYKAIKEVDPKAEFIICGDGYTWSDWRWPLGVFEEMKKAGMKDIAGVSNHMYLFGGTGISFVDGQHLYDGLLAANANLKYLHGTIRAKLDSLGYTQTKLAVTETNFGAANCPTLGAPAEHGMGRALGEAEIFPDRINRYSMLVHHDMVRNDEPKVDGTWFCRIFYYPKNPKGQRYKLPLDGQVMKIMGEHALRQIISHKNGMTVSQWTDGLLISVGNPLPIERKVKLSLENFSAGGEKIPVICFSAENLDTLDFKIRDLTAGVTTEAGSTILTFTVPKYSFCHFRVK